MTRVTSTEIRPEPSEHDERAILAALGQAEDEPTVGAWARAALEENVESP